MPFRVKVDGEIFIVPDIAKVYYPYLGAGDYKTCKEGLKRARQCVHDFDGDRAIWHNGYFDIDEAEEYGCAMPKLKDAGDKGKTSVSIVRASLSIP